MDKFYALYEGPFDESKDLALRKLAGELNANVLSSGQCKLWNYGNPPQLVSGLLVGTDFSEPNYDKHFVCQLYANFHWIIGRIWFIWGRMELEPHGQEESSRLQAQTLL